MNGRRYALGLDFGTESGRALLVDVETGEEVSTSVHEYPDGVLDETLPGGTARLEEDWALQNPQDYIETLGTTIPDVMSAASAAPEQVVGVGVDFTACTMLPVDRSGMPLCTMDRFRGEPHAWVKLWKHHAAQPDADRINEVARARGESFLARYGRKISSEWLFPKILQVLDEAPDVYAAAHRFIEAGDWLVLRLTGRERRSACQAGYKAMWEKGSGYPSVDYFAALDPRLTHVVAEKLSPEVYPAGARAGELTKEMAVLTGLREGTPVGVAIIDAHAAVPASTVVEPGRMVMVMGTSTCHMVLDRERRLIEGISGVVQDGIVPGLFGYEAGQASSGDIFGWFVENALPASCAADAEQRGMDLHELLEERASRFRPGEIGLLALDWWNGNRSILVDADLTGLIVGYTMGTKPEEIYRALIEATAYGTHKIIRAFEDGGVEVNELCACGGLPKNRLLMQIYADVTGREIRITESSQTSALGAAMLGAVAAGRTGGGYDLLSGAAEAMARLGDETFCPIAAHRTVYRELFGEYERLHDYFGRGTNDLMRRLKRSRRIV